MRPPRRSPRGLLAALALCGALAACGDGPPTTDPADPGLPYDLPAIPVRHAFVEIRQGTPDGRVLERTPAQALERARTIAARMRAPGADVEAIVAEMSDDAVTRAAGGFVGFLALWSNDAPPIVAAVAALADGAVSDPIAVPVPAGYHVFQRLSRAQGLAIEARTVASIEGLLLRWGEFGSTRPRTRSKADAYAAAAAALADLRAGKPVVDVVATTPDVRTVVLAMRRAKTPGWERVTEAMLAAEPNVWHDPLETSDGWAVVRRLPYLRTTVRHLVVTHRESPPGFARPDRPPALAAQLAARALERLDADPSSWDRVVAETSDEIPSRTHHGFFGEVTNAVELSRRVAPEIEEAVRALRPGERSRVVESRIGFHVFWRLD